MKRLGYEHYVAQGGDWGAPVTEQLALLAPPGLVGIHTNMPPRVPADDLPRRCGRRPAPAGLSADESRAYDQLAASSTRRPGLRPGDGSRPQTLYGLADSPIGLAAWMLDHDARATR